MEYAEIEWVEGQAWADALQAVPESVRQEHGIVGECSGARAWLCGAGLGSLLFNRVVGLGMLGLGGRAQATRQALAADLARYAQAGVRRYMVHLAPGAQPAALRSWLTEHGLERYPRSWAKFVRGRAAVHRPDCALRVVPAGSTQAAAFAGMLTRGFDLPPEAEPIFAAMVGRPHWHPFVALDGELPVGAGSLYVREGVAYLAAAATEPSHRCRGAQGALMAARIAAALDLGCVAVSTETGEAVPGDPQHSYRNMVRQGFEVAYLRENFVPHGVRW